MRKEWSKVHLNNFMVSSTVIFNHIISILKALLAACRGNWLNFLGKSSCMSDFFNWVQIVFYNMFHTFIIYDCGFQLFLDGKTSCGGNQTVYPFSDLENNNDKPRWMLCFSSVPPCTALVFRGVFIGYISKDCVCSDQKYPEVKMWCKTEMQ